VEREHQVQQLENLAQQTQAAAAVVDIMEPLQLETAALEVLV
jgi:hypothetical protein